MKKRPVFSKEILESGLSVEEVDEREKYYILYFNSFSDVNPKGLNLTLGGHNCHSASLETRKKIGEANSRRV